MMKTYVESSNLLNMLCGNGDLTHFPMLRDVLTTNVTHAELVIRIYSNEKNHSDNMEYTYAKEFLDLFNSLLNKYNNRERKADIMNKRLEQLVSVLERDAFIAIDNHSGKEQNVGLIVFESGKISIFQTDRYRYQSLQETYVDVDNDGDGRVHICEASNAGVLWYGKDAWDFDRYNEMQTPENALMPNRIVKVITKEGVLDII